MQKGFVIMKGLMFFSKPLATSSAFRGTTRWLVLEKGSQQPCFFQDGTLGICLDLTVLGTPVTP